jgi:MEMO1 family protein
MKKDPSLRYPLVEGLFYPAEKEALEKEVASFLTGEKGDSPALILPHASFGIIGTGCGQAWMRSANRPVSRILLLAPVHREPAPYAALPPFERFASPLGEIKTDRELLRKLAQESPLFQEDIMPYEEEHSQELNLPFISQLFPEASIIPLLIGSPKRKEIKIMGKILRSLLEPVKEELLVIISTNLSRFITPEVSQKEADNFVSYIHGENLSERDLHDISACGIKGLDLFKEMNLYGGKFKELERKKETGKENRKPASLHYGTFFLENEGMTK